MNPLSYSPDPDPDILLTPSPTLTIPDSQMPFLLCASFIY